MINEETTNHSGYCSDPGEEEVENETYTENYKYDNLDDFIFRYVDDDGEVNDNGLAAYTKSMDIRKLSFRCCGVDKNIVSGKLVKVKNIKEKYKLD